MQLFDLSLDLASSILDYLEPHDFESLALVCYGTYMLLTPFLARHNAYRRVWHKVVLGDSLLPMCSSAESQSARPGQRKTLRTIHQLLVQIAKYPESVRYVQHLDLACREWELDSDPRAYLPDPHNETSTSSDPNGIVSKRLTTDLAAISPVLQRLDPELRHWYKDLDLDKEWYDGEAHYPTLFLLSVLPNLRTVTLPGMEGQLTLQLLKINTHLNTLQLEAAQRPYYNTSNSIDMTVLLPFLALPSLRNVRFNRATLGDFREDVWACYRPLGAQVEELDLNSSCWTIEAGTALIQDMKALRVLKVNFGLKDIYFDHSCQGAVDTMAKATRKTLEVLSLISTLRWEQTEEKPLRSLRGFERLRELELSTGLFFTKVDGYGYPNGVGPNDKIDLEADFEYTCDFRWQDHECGNECQEGEEPEEMEEMDDRSQADSHHDNTDRDDPDPGDVDDKHANDSVNEDMDSDNEDDCFSVHGDEACLAKTCPSLTQLLRSESLATLEKLTLHVEAQDLDLLCMKRLLRNLQGLGVGGGGSGGGSDGDGGGVDDENTPHPCPRLTSLVVCLYTQLQRRDSQTGQLVHREQVDRVLELAQDWLAGIPGCKVRVVPYEQDMCGSRAAWHAGVARCEIVESGLGRR